MVHSDLKSALKQKAHSQLYLEDEKSYEDFLPKTRNIVKGDRKLYLDKTLVGIFFQIIFALFTIAHALNLEPASFRVRLNMPLNAKNAKVEHLIFENVYETLDQVTYLGHIYQYLHGRHMFYIRRFPMIHPPSDNTNIKSMMGSIGKIRIKQHRTNGYKCKDLRGGYTTCYNDFGMLEGSKQDYGVYNPYRFSNAENTQQSGFVGNSGTYYPGNGYYFDISLDSPEDEFALNQLMTNSWIDKGSRIVSISSNHYNPNVNLFMNIRLDFEIMVDGCIFHYMTVFAYNILPVGYENLLVLICFIFITIFVCANFLVVFRESLYFGWPAFIMWWNIVDIGIFAIHICLLYIIFSRMSVRGSIVQDLGEKAPYIFHTNIESYCYMSETFKIVSVVQALFILIRTLQFLNFNATMTNLAESLKQCSLQLILFIPFYMYAFFCAMVVCVVVFDCYYKFFTSLDDTFASLFIMSFGIIQIVPRKRTKIADSVFFIMFIIIIIYLLQKFFLCIIWTTYSEVKTQFHKDSAEKKLQLFHVILSKLKAIIRFLGFKVMKYKMPKETSSNVSIIKILQRLQFSPLEINVFFEKYRVDIDAEVADYDEEQLLEYVEQRAKFNRLEKEIQDFMLAKLDKATFRGRAQQIKYLRELIKYANKQLDRIIQKITAVEEQ